MAFFDMLKNKATQAAQVAGAKAANNFGQAAKQAVANVGNKTYTVTLSGIPANLAELKAMPEGALKEPQHSVALTEQELNKIDTIDMMDMIDFFTIKYLRNNLIFQNNAVIHNTNPSHLVFCL